MTELQVQCGHGYRKDEIVSEYAGSEGCAGLAGAEPLHKRRVMGDRITYVGPNVHKEAVCYCGGRGRFARLVV